MPLILHWQKAHMVLIQTSINISAKVLLWSWNQHSKLVVYYMFHEGYGPPTVVMTAETLTVLSGRVSYIVVTLL